MGRTGSLVPAAALLIVAALAGCRGGGTPPGPAVAAGKPPAELSASELRTWATPEDYRKAGGDGLARYAESPLLSRLVRHKELPAVTDRLPAEPLVVGVAEQIGRYGGSLVAHSSSREAWNDVVLSFLLDGAVMLSNDTTSILPGWALSHSVSDDARTLTLTFREGMKWSDGEPFGVDDVLFWWEDDMSNPELTPQIPEVWKPGGEPLRLIKIDGRTLTIASKDPYPSLLYLLAQYHSHQGRMFHPKHYLSKWHIRYNSEAGELARSEGFSSWAGCFNFHKQFEPFPRDVELPTISAWRLERMEPTRAVYGRNAYYWKVDTAGNQLPYVDEVVCAIVTDPDAIAAKAVAGELDYICTDLSLDGYSVYRQYEKQNGFRLLDWTSTSGNLASFAFNLNSKDAVLGELFNDVRFRQAMSVAIDRDTINQALFHGRATPRATTVLPDSSFYDPAWASSYARRDVALANRLLDDVGLARRDKEGFRLRPDGKTLRIVINAHDVGSCLPITEMVAEHWRAVGVRTAIEAMDWGSFFLRRDGLQFDVDVWPLGLSMEGSLHANPDRFAPYGGENRPGPAWGQWFASGGKQGQEPPRLVKDVRRSIERWKAVPQSDSRYADIARSIYGAYAAQTWYIGTVGMAPVPAIVDADLGNVPSTGYYGNEQGFARTFGPWQWFYQR